MKKLIFISLLVSVLTTLTGLSQSIINSTGPEEDYDSPGIINITEFNAGIGIFKINENYSRHVLNLTSIFGIGLAKNITGGIGAGVSFYNGGNLFPLFVDFRYYTYIKNTKVFVFGESGILLKSAESFGRTAIFGSPGAGIILHVGDNLSVSFAASLFTQFRRDSSHDSFIFVKNGVIYSFKRRSRS